MSEANCDRVADDELFALEKSVVAKKLDTERSQGVPTPTSADSAKVVVKSHRAARQAPDDEGPRETLERLVARNLAI